MRNILFLILSSISAFGQKEKELIGSWKQEKVYTVKDNEFIMNSIGEPHPFDTLRLNNDKTFTVNCFSTHPKDFRSDLTYWTIAGEWEFADPELRFRKIRNVKTNKRRINKTAYTI